MIFFCDNSGTIFKTVPEKVYQGSVNANTIYLVGAFDQDCVVTAKFTLPNGLYATEQIMSSAYTALPGDIQTKNGIKYGVWSLALNSVVTELSGTVQVQFTVTNANVNGVAATICTALSSFTVEKGVPVLQDDSIDNYESLLTQIKAVLTALQQGDTENSIASAASAEAARISAENAAESEQQALAAQENAQASAESASQSESIISGMAAQIQGYIKQTEQNTLNITNIQAVLQGNSQYAEITISEAYTSRFTANGANIFDGQLTPVESIRGSTVKNKNLVIVGNQTVSTNNTAYSITYPTKTMRFEKGKTYTWSWDYKIVAYTPPNAGVKLGYGFVVKDDEDGGGKSIIYGDPYSNQTVGVVSRQKATFVSPYNGELRYFWFIRTNGNNTTTLEISNIMIEEGATNGEYIPYFTGLKNANINSIVSTGKNLFDKTAVMDITNWNKGIYNQYLSFVFKKGTHYVLTMRENNCVRENMDFGMWLCINSKAEDWVGIKVANANYPSINKTSVQIYNETEDLYFIMYVDGGLDNQKLNTIFNDIFVDMMIVEGVTEISYEPYTTYTYQLPQTVELGEFDIINPPEQTLTRYTETIVFETTSDYWEMTSSGIFKYTGYLPETPDITQTGGFGVCNLFDPVSSQNPNGSCGIGVDGYFVVIKQDINSLEDFLSYLQTQETNGNPLTLVYKTAEPVSSVTFNAPQTYEVYQGGIETIVQGETDNSEYGAKPTITQTYLGKVGE